MRRGQKMSAEQVVLKLPQIEVQTAQGKSLALACTEAEISEQSYRWRKEYGGLQVDEARKIKDLERENAQLRRLMADLSLVSQVPAGGCWHPGEVRSPGTSRLPDRRPTPRAQRYVPTVLADEDELTRAIIALASESGRYGYRRVPALLQAAGWQVGKDRVQRIWRRAGSPWVYGRTHTTASGRTRLWVTSRPRLSATRIWPSGYPWQRPCSSLSLGSVRNTGQVSHDASRNPTLAPGRDHSRRHLPRGASHAGHAQEEDGCPHLPR
jgi:putative transposase